LLTLYRVRYLVNPAAAPLENAALLVAGSQIVAVGRYVDLKGVAEREVDCGDGIIAPLLVNAHTHLELSDYPQWAQEAQETAAPESFVDWILQLIRVRRKLQIGTEQSLLALKNGLVLSLAAGTGLIGDILSNFAVVRAYQGSMLKGRLFLETLGRDPAHLAKIEESLAAALAQQNHGAVIKGISPHAPYTIAPAYMRRVYQRCHDQQLFCCTHLAESSAEVEFIEQGRGDMAERFFPAVGWQEFIPPASGLRPVAYLDQLGGLFPENLLVHGVQLNDDEIALLAKRKMSLVLCPRSNARLKVGHAPAARLLHAGVRLALGTDSLSSCDSLSIWDEMAFAHRWFAAQIDAPTLFHMATLGGAECLGFASQCGSLQPGKFADFQILQPDSNVALDDIFDYFVAPGCSAAIVQVYQQGQPQLSGIA